MRTPTFVRVAASAVTAAAIFAVAEPCAHAAGMDPTPERLVLQPPNLPNGFSTCGDVSANPQGVAAMGLKPGELHCSPDNVAYRNLMSELGFALAPTAMHPARTTGVGGFALTLEASFTHINADAVSTAADGTKVQYWHQGTQGAVDPSRNQFSIRNNSPDSLIQVYSLKARKGLPFGFELAGSLGYVANTTLWVAGGDVRWALLEGFRTGALGYLPDIAVGGGVRTVSGSSKFYLTTVGIDAQLSKPIPLADSAVLTPYIGYQRLIILADSTIIDATPNVDALNQCGYQGTDQFGQPKCANKLTTPSGPIDNNGDFNNNITFNKVRVHRNRGIVGLNYRYELLYLAGQFATDITNPADENPDIVGDRQWTLSFEGGGFF